jgi:hypothetical protein
MKGGNSPGEKGHPVWHGPRHRRRTSAESASIKIFHSVTSDSPDGQPWPPTERNILWRLVRRADDCSYWRAIELAESDPLPRTFAISLGQQSQLKGSQHEEG